MSNIHNSLAQHLLLFAVWSGAAVLSLVLFLPKGFFWILGAAVAIVVVLVVRITQGERATLFDLPVPNQPLLVAAGLGVLTPLALRHVPFLFFLPLPGFLLLVTFCISLHWYFRLTPEGSRRHRQLLLGMTILLIAAFFLSLQRQTHRVFSMLFGNDSYIFFLLFLGVLVVLAFRAPRQSTHSSVNVTSSAGCEPNSPIIASGTVPTQSISAEPLKRQFIRLLKLVAAHVALWIPFALILLSLVNSNAGLEALAPLLITLIVTALLNIALFVWQLKKYGRIALWVLVPAIVLYTAECMVTRTICDLVSPFTVAELIWEFLSELVNRIGG